MAAPQPKILVLELVDRKKSSFILEDTFGTPEQKHLDAPSAYYLKNISIEKVKDGKGGHTYKKLRYINGCDTPYFDEQVEKNFKPNPNMDVIEVKNGNLTVVRNGRDIGLYEYLMKCEFNESNENRPEGAEVKFRVLDTQKDSTKVLDNMYSEMEAMKAVYALGTKTKDGYIWDEEKIDYLCSLFSIDPTSEYATKVNHLLSLAKSQPQGFIKSIANVTASMQVEVAQAMQWQVVSISGDHASFMDGGKKFHSFKATNNEGKIQELVDYFLTRKGQNDYKTMAISTIHAKEKEGAVA